MHGLIMVFRAVTPIAIGAFGNYTIPLLIGARDMAFPRLNMYSFWTFVLSQVLIVASFFVEFGSAAAGWTTYPPLSTNVGTPGLGSFAALYFWFPKMFGRRLNATLGKLHFWCSVTGVTLVFSMQCIAGFHGQQRRLYDPFVYTFLQHLQDLNRYTSYVAFILGAAQLFFVINFFWALRAGRKAEKNPWEVGTLEWTECDSPPVVHNFDTVPCVYRGPYELSNPEVLAQLDRDWIGQSEQLPSAAACSSRATPAAATPGGAPRRSSARRSMRSPGRASS